MSVVMLTVTHCQELKNGDMIFYDTINSSLSFVFKNVTGS
jgi:hypothetical protein